MSRLRPRAKSDERSRAGEQSKSKRSPAELYNAAWRHFLSKRYGPAEDRCQQALALDPKHADSFHLLGLVHAQTGRLASAVDLIASALRCDPNNPEYFLNLGGMLQRQKKFVEARKSFDLAIKLAPNSPAGWIKLGNLLRIQGQRDEALLTYEHAFRLDPNNADALAGSGGILFDLRRYAEALAKFDLSDAISPNQIEVLCAKGDCLRHFGRNEEAIAVYRRALELAPDRSSVWSSIGVISVRLGERDVAINAFRKAREIDPSDPSGAGIWLMRLGAEEVSEMSPAYVRSLFDEYAPTFDTALVKGLGYRGPWLLVEAVTSACRALPNRTSFKRAIDLGCGTGLAAVAFAEMVDQFIGIDLSPGMIEKARATGLYAELKVTDMLKGLRSTPDSGADLVLSTDAMVYVADLLPVLKEASRVLAAGGFLAFTLERHDGDGFILGEGLRYAHSESYVRTSIEAAGLAILQLEPQSSRNEKSVPVPGFVIVAQKP
jgi:predicted TPR repeat methyltransferase